MVCRRIHLVNTKPTDPKVTKAMNKYQPRGQGLKKVANYFAVRFSREHGLDRRRVATRVFEYMAYRYFLDLIAIVIAVLVLIGQLLIALEVAIPTYGGLSVVQWQGLFFVVFAFYVIVERLLNLKEYRRIVIDNIPRLRDETRVSTVAVAKDAASARASAMVDPKKNRTK